MPIHNDKLEGKNKVKALALALCLAIVLLGHAVYSGTREVAPSAISDIRVGQHIQWEETTMRCNLTVYSVIGAVLAGDKVTETNSVCGAIECKPTSPLVKDTYKEQYVCYDVDALKSRL